jgi:hypothetical protein
MVASDPALSEFGSGRFVAHGAGPPLSARTLVGLLADPGRRAVFAALVLGAENGTEVGERTGLAAREVASALDRLTRSGLVEQLPGGGCHLLAQAFELAARAEASDPSPSAFGDETDDRRRVLDQAFRDGRLVQLPVKRSRRLVVLDHVVQRFEPGRRYSERQINAMLAPVDADVAALRRYLVDEAMLDRADGYYWRIGGTVEVGGSQ